MYTIIKLPVFLLILTLGVSMLPGQTKQVVIKKKHDGDSLSTTVRVENEVAIIGDGTQDHFIWVDDDHVNVHGDSLVKNVFVHRIPHHERKAARIIIKESGFFKKNKIVIDFDPATKVIRKVVDNKKEIPPKKFHKYQDYLDEATELEPLEALHPVMEEFDLQLELGELPNLEVLEGLDSLIIKLEALESKHAVLKKERYKSMKHVIKLDHLIEGIQDILSDAGLTPPQKIEEIEIKKGKFYLNGEELEGDIGDKCIQLYTDHSDLSPEDLEKKGDEISIHISF